MTDPQFIGLADLALGLLLDYLKPLGFVVILPLLSRIVIGGCLLALGGSMAARARATFFAVGASDNPMQPALAMISTGIFSHVRNPMYQGGTLLLIGLALILGSDWMVILVVPALILLHFGVVVREEHDLCKKFDDASLRPEERGPNRQMESPANCKGAGVRRPSGPVRPAERLL
jgi:protein-S-isoprenylcysteine O-methyltransferase Ste14